MPKIKAIIVTHDHQIFGSRRQKIRNFVLHMVRVLILVHRNVREAVLVLCEHLRKAAQKHVSIDEKIVEVHRIGPTQAFLQLIVDIGAFSRHGALGRVGHFLWHDQRIFCSRNLHANSIEWERFLLDLQIVHDSFDQAFRVIVIVNRKVGPKAEQRSIVSQNAHA